MEQHASQGLLLEGFGRRVVFSRLRAAIGLYVELPLLLRGIELPRGGRFLEIGAGLGWGSLGLIRRDRSLKAVATDYDAEVLPVAREYLERRGAAAQAAFCRADAKHLPFADSSFDIVLCLYALHHVQGYARAISEIARVTKPSGLFLFIDPVAGGRLLRLHHGALPSGGFPDRAGFTRMLAEAGFEVERWRALLPGLAMVAARRLRQASVLERVS